MNRIELIRSVNDWSKPRRRDYYTDDFQLTNAQGAPPMDADATIAMGQMMQSAMPDIRTVIEDIREEGDDLWVTSHWEGTFVNDFDLSPVGMDVLPATGEAVVFPTSTILVSFEDDKISRIHNPDTGPDAGQAGFFKALGLKLE